MLNFYGSFFTLIFAVLLVVANFHMRPEYLTIAISNLNFNFPPLIVQITAGGPKVPIEGFVPLDAPQRKNTRVLNASALIYLTVILVSTFQLFYFPIYYKGPKFKPEGPTPPGRPLAEKFFTQSEHFAIFNCVFNFNILGLVVSETSGVLNLRQEPCAPCTPPSGKFFVRQARTLLCLMAFLISTFQLFYFPRYQGGPKFTLGGPTPPSGDIFVPKASTSQYLIVFNFNILAPAVSEILGGPKFTLGGPVTPCTLLSRKFFVPEASTLLCLIAILISTFQLFYFPRYQGVSNLHQGAIPPLDAPSGEIFVPKACTSQYLIVFLISTFQLQQFPRF